jgi:branched-chain amino acid aminotransferase
MSLVWINGTLADKADARVSPFDHGFLYGDGVWEHLRVFGGKPFHPHDHLNLLFAAAETLGIDIPLSRDDLLAAIETTVKANGRTEGYVRVIVTRGPGTIGPDPRKLDPQVYITAEEYQPFPQELHGHGLHAAVAPVRVDAANPALAVRSLGRPHVVLAKQHALRNGCLEAILVSTAGDVAGTTEGFLFLAKDGAVVVAGGQPADVAGFAIATLAVEAGLVVAEYAVKPVELPAADEVFTAGTACGVIGIVRIDGRTIGTGTEGPITQQLRDRYHALTRGRTSG